MNTRPNDGYDLVVKKFKVEPTVGSQWSTVMFESAEAAFVYAVDRDPTVLKEAKRLSVEPNEHLELEWMGVEYAYDGPSDTVPSAQVSTIRFGRLRDQSEGPRKIVSLGAGYVLPEHLPLDGTQPTGCSIVRVGPDDEQHDLGEIFKKVADATEATRAERTSDR